MTRISKTVLLALVISLFYSTASAQDSGSLPPIPIKRMGTLP